MNTDNVLWKGLLQGDREMFLALYKKYYHSLLFIGLNEIRDAQLAKDIIQQLFLYIWEKRKTLQEADNVKSYLVTSFLRKLSSEWKKSAKSSGLQVAWVYNSMDPQPGPEELLIKKDGQEQLTKLLMSHISNLPNRQRDLIVLRFYEGLSYDEIVQQTGLSHRTVYNKVHEALKKLKTGIVKEDAGHSASLVLLLAAMVSCTAAADYSSVL